MRLGSKISGTGSYISVVMMDAGSKFNGVGFNAIADNHYSPQPLQFTATATDNPEPTAYIQLT